MYAWNVYRVRLVGNGIFGLHFGPPRHGGRGRRRRFRSVSDPRGTERGPLRVVAGHRERERNAAQRANSNGRCSTTDPSSIILRFLLDWKQIRRKRRKTRRLAVAKTGRRKNRTYYYGVGRYFTQSGDIPYQTKLGAYACVIKRRIKIVYASQWN